MLSFYFKSLVGIQSAGLVTYVYEGITADIFGLQNVGVGFFGLLKGRSSYIQTVYFDGTLWIDRGFDQMNGGAEYFNCYVSQESEGKAGNWED
jgi:hypothetical protein